MLAGLCLQAVIVAVVAAVLGGLPRSATVRARTDAELIGYTGKAFRERLGPAGVRNAIEGREVSIDQRLPPES